MKSLQRAGTYGYSGGELHWILTRYGDGPLSACVEIVTTKAFQIGLTWFKADVLEHFNDFDNNH